MADEPRFLLDDGLAADAMADKDVDAVEVVVESGMWILSSHLDVTLMFLLVEHFRFA